MKQAPGVTENLKSRYLPKVLLKSNPGHGLYRKFSLNANL
jgi:hypothetical protein